MPSARRSAEPRSLTSSNSRDMLLRKGRFLMLRSILAVVLGYVVMAALTMLSFTPAFLTPELVFETDGTGVTVGFLVFSLAMGGVAAVVGGSVAALLAGKHVWPSLGALVVIVLVLGVGSAVYGLFQAPPTVLPRR